MCRYNSKIEERIGFEQTSAGDAEKMAHLLFQTSRDAIVLLDTEWRIVAANDKCARLLGWDSLKLRSRRFSQLFPVSEKERFRDALNRLTVEDKESWSGVMQLCTPNGCESRLAVEMHRLELERRTLFQVIMRKPEPDGRAEEPGWDGVEKWLVSLKNTTGGEPEEMQARMASQLAQPDVGTVSGAKGLQMFSVPQTVPASGMGLNRGGGQQRFESPQETDRDLLKLTPTELEVCRYIHDGLSSKEIADVMKSSFETIQTHRKNIRRKMGLRGRKTALGTYLKVEKRLFQLDGVQAGAKADK
jgi:PAS domain S-box-containing protein